MSRTEDAIQVAGVTKAYRSFFRRNPIRALNQVDLKVRRGAAFDLQGPNGAAKNHTHEDHDRRGTAEFRKRGTIRMAGPKRRRRPPRGLPSRDLRFPAIPHCAPTAPIPTAD